MPKVLHIEDDAANRMLVGKVLEADGFAVVTAESGIDGIRKALATQPDVILLDIELPDMDGYEVTLKLRGELSGREVPIVALTGKGDEQMIRAVGCDGHIFKPIDINRLPSQVRSFITMARHRARADQTDGEGLLLAQGQKIAGRLQAKIEELERTNKQLLGSEKVRTEFYRNLSHELSTPLTPAVGYLNMLLAEDLGPLTPLQRKAVESIGRGVTRVRAVVENLLDMTALATGKMSFFARYYDFNKPARESISLCSGTFDERGITVEMAIPEIAFRGFGDGAGLGLALARKIVERFGGEIWAESPPRGESERLRWAKTMVGLWVPEKMPEDGPTR